MAEHQAVETVETKSYQRAPPPPAKCIQAAGFGTCYHDEKVRVSPSGARSPKKREDLPTRLRCGGAGVIDHLLTEVGPEMQRRIIRKYQGALRAGEAEDVLMIAVQKLWTHRLQFDAVNGTLEGWLWRIADNVARDLIRTAWCRARCLEDDLQSDRLDERCEATAVRGAEDILSTGSTSNTLARLQQALARLPDGQRRVVLADACSPEGTVQSQALADELGIEVHGRGTFV